MGLRGQPGAHRRHDQPSGFGTTSPFPGAEAVVATSPAAFGSREAQEQAKGAGGTWG